MKLVLPDFYEDELFKAYNKIHLGTYRCSIEEMGIRLEKIEEARSKQAMLVARSQMADAKAQMAKTLGNMDSKSAFAKMDKMEQKIAAKEAQADAFSEVSGVQESENDPFAQMDKENSINAELEKLKQELNNK